MATQLADRGPDPDFLSGKFGPRLTIGPKFVPLHLFGHGTHCHVERAIPQITVKFFFCLQSHLGFQ